MRHALRRMATAKTSGAMGLCGRPLCTGAERETELSVIRLRCGQCTAGDDLLQDAEVNLVPRRLLSNDVNHRNFEAARAVARQAFAELEAQCLEERCSYREAGMTPPVPKGNTWATYTDKARLKRFMADSLEFVLQNADCRMRLMSPQQLRFIILLQHFVSEDTRDFYRPEWLRKHQDAFEGVLTNGVNSQLVKDAHRSEFSIDGQAFCIQDLHHHVDEQKRSQVIADFQVDLVKHLETYLLAFAQRRGLSPLCTRRLVQAVTTQMSQAGLANLDRGSQASKYFVGSNGLDQRTAYNLSTMDVGEFGECLKLSVLCMKTGFTQYLEKDELLQTPRSAGIECPKRCSPSSYLYQYATLCFTPGIHVKNNESTVCTCTVLDALDETHIYPADL